MVKISSIFQPILAVYFMAFLFHQNAYFTSMLTKKLQVVDHLPGLCPCQGRSQDFISTEANGEPEVAGSRGRAPGHGSVDEAPLKLKAF